MLLVLDTSGCGVSKATYAGSASARVISSLEPRHRTRFVSRPRRSSRSRHFIRPAACGWLGPPSSGFTRRWTGLRLAPLSPAIAIDAGNIPRTALADPLDRLLVATARQLDATFLTRDTPILQYASKTGNVRVHDAAV